MSQSMYYTPAFNVMSSDEAPMIGGSSAPSPAFRGNVRVTLNTQAGGSEPSAQHQGVEVVVQDSGLDVLGYLSMSQAQAAVDAAVQAAIPSSETVLPSGYIQATDATTGKVRITTPGGRWVEYDPTDNTFRV